jgi:hypothetical protein
MPGKNMKEVIIIDHDDNWKGTWYHSGQVFQIEDEDAKPPHVPGYYRQVGTTNTIDKKHCFILNNS